MKTIFFEVVDPKSAAGEYRSKEHPSPYITLVDPTEDLEFLQDKDAIVISDTSITIEFDYPFKNPCICNFTSEGEGFHRWEIAKLISEQYQRMYNEEDLTGTGVAGLIPGMLNRTTSDGTYGIWGHDLGDLVLHSLWKNDDTGRWKLGVDS